MATSAAKNHSRNIRASVTREFIILTCRGKGGRREVANDNIGVCNRMTKLKEILCNIWKACMTVLSRWTISSEGVKAKRDEVSRKWGRILEEG